MNARSLTESDIKQRLISLGHSEISIDYSTYRGINVKCRFVDTEYGEWWAIPGNVLRKGCRHPKRGHGEGGRKQTHSVERFKKRLRERHGDVMTVDESTYVNTHTKARFIDKDYGEYWTRPDAVLNPGQLHPLRARDNARVKMRLPVDEFKHRLKQVHGDTVTLDETSYVDTKQDARFIHSQYGPWMGNPFNVLKGHSHPVAGRERYKKTMKRLYGSEHPSQCREIALRMSRGQSRRILVPHWKTGEEVVCTASYEYAIVNELNRRRLDYDHQIRFQLAKCVYYCDFYVKSWDLYVEIKGYLRPKSAAKWEEFRASQVEDFTQQNEWAMRHLFKKALTKASNAKKLGVNEPPCEDDCRVSSVSA